MAFCETISALHVVYYEFIEYMQLPNEKGRCVKELEMAQVPDGFKRDYLSMRKAFFENLIGYAWRMQTLEFEQSSARLESML